MKPYILVPLLVLFLSACSTKVKESIEKSNTQDVANLIQQLIKKEKELHNIKKELEQCQMKQK